jgi:hypothetical protein
MNGVIKRLQTVSAKLGKLCLMLERKDSGAKRQVESLRKLVRHYACDCRDLQCSLLEAGYTNEATNRLGEVCAKYEDTLKKLDALLIK